MKFLEEKKINKRLKLFITYRAISLSFLLQILLNDRILGNNYCPYKEGPLNVEHELLYHYRVSSGSDCSVKHKILRKQVNAMSTPYSHAVYMGKQGIAGAYIIFLLFAQNIDFRYMLQPPHWGDSNEFQKRMSGTWKKENL